LRTASVTPLFLLPETFLGLATKRGGRPLVVLQKAFVQIGKISVSTEKIQMRIAYKLAVLTRYLQVKSCWVFGGYELDNSIKYFRKS
jgi:hypothetical protein